jgi:L-threonylcarbamoyladenylate synthase
MHTDSIPIDDPLATELAINMLQSGGVIAFPTDTIYGVAALVHNTTAIQKLFSIKGRDQNKAIAVLIGSLTQFEHVGNLSAVNNDDQVNDALTLAHHFWPGALTLVVPRHPGLPEILSPLPTIGVRMPDYQPLQELLERTGPLATTSANLSGGANPTSAQQVLEQLDGRIDLLFDGGETPGPIPSTVVDCTHKRSVVLRQGAIPTALLQDQVPNLLSCPP